MSTRVFAGDPWRRTVPRSPAVRAAPRRAGTRVPTAAAACFAALTVLACGADDPGAADVAVLADRADRLAEHLDAGEGCLADREGADLVARARDAVAADRLSEEAAEEIVAVVSEVTAAIPCEDDPGTDEEPATEDAREDAEDEAPEDEAPVDETPEDEAPEDEAPEDEAPEDEGPEEGRGRGNDGNGPPGRSEQGPPGQRGNPGRGR